MDWQLGGRGVKGATVCMPWRKNSRPGIRGLVPNWLYDIGQVISPLWVYFSICKAPFGSNGLEFLKIPGRYIMTAGIQSSALNAMGQVDVAVLRCTQLETQPQPVFYPQVLQRLLPLWGLISVWVQVAGALAEAGVGLEEITERVSMVTKAMGECLPRDWGGEGRRLRLTLGLGACSHQLRRKSRHGVPQGLREGLPGGASVDW